MSSKVVADSRKVLGDIDANVDKKKMTTGKKAEKEGVSVNIARKKIAPIFRKSVKGDKRKSESENDGVIVMAKKPVVTKEMSVQTEPAPASTAVPMECQTDATFDVESGLWALQCVDYRQLAETRLAVIEELRKENDEMFGQKIEALDENERLRGYVRQLVKEIRKLSGEEVSDEEDFEDGVEEREEEQPDSAGPSEVEQAQEESTEVEEVQENKDDEAGSEESEEPENHNEDEDEAKQDSNE